MLQLVAPGAEDKPAAQGAHKPGVNAPAKDEYVPAGHGVQLFEPGASEYVPAAHAVHAGL